MAALGALTIALAATVGAAEIRDLAYEIETAGREEKLGELSASAESLKAAFERYRAAVVEEGLTESPVV